MHGGRDRGIRQLPGYSHYKELGTIQNVVIHFLKKVVEIPNQNIGKGFLRFVCVCVLGGGGESFVF